MQKCAHCGEPLIPGMNFCGKCGTPAQRRPNLVVCPKCGKSAQGDELFCVSCGTRLGSTPAPPDTPLPTNKKLVVSWDRQYTDSLTKPYEVFINGNPTGTVPNGGYLITDAGSDIVDLEIAASHKTLTIRGLVTRKLKFKLRLGSEPRLAFKVLASDKKLKLTNIFNAEILEQQII